MNHLKKLPAVFAFCLLTMLKGKGQIPTNIDPGLNDKSVSLYQQPEFIIPILTLFVVLIGYYFFRKRRKK